MDKTTSTLARLRREIYEDIKQEDLDEVYANSKKATVHIHRRMKTGQDPWMYCFSFNDNESNKSAERSYTSLEKVRKGGKFLDMILKGSSVTDEELNHCKAALRREARVNHLPDLSSNPQKLQLLFSKFREQSPKYLDKQERLYGEIVCNAEKLELCLKNGLETLQPLSTTTVTANITVDMAKVVITRTRKAMEDLKRFADSAEESLGIVFEKFDKYQELDEEIDCEVFKILAHFLTKFLVPRSVRKREDTSL